MTERIQWENACKILSFCLAYVKCSVNLWLHSPTISGECYIRLLLFKKKKKESLKLILVLGGNGFDLVYGFWIE